MDPALQERRDRDERPRSRRPILRASINSSWSTEGTAAVFRFPHATLHVTHVNTSLINQLAQAKALENVNARYYTKSVNNAYTN